MKKLSMVMIALAFIFQSQGQLSNIGKLGPDSLLKGDLRLWPLNSYWFDFRLNNDRVELGTYSTIEVRETTKKRRKYYCGEKRITQLGKDYSVIMSEEENALYIGDDKYFLGEYTKHIARKSEQWYVMRLMKDGKSYVAHVFQSALYLDEDYDFCLVCPPKPKKWETKKYPLSKPLFPRRNQWFIPYNEYGDIYEKGFRPSGN